MDAPKIPTLKDSQKPQVKVRGLEAGVTLFDRLKQFKKKDLAFILAGLGTLFMAPLAEHFMMAPEQASDLSAGVGGGGKGTGGGLFSGNGSSPYEPGATGLASGNPAGGSLSDIITPLNVRDPSALVMGPGATQQPPTQSAAPATPPPTAPVARSESDLKDALASSGIHAANAASKAAKALLPVPKVGLGNNSLRGLGVTSGGTSASGGLAPISAANVSNKASTGGGLSTVKALPGYRGPAGSRGQGQGGSGIEALKAAADKQGNVMNQGSASTALDQAAAQQIPGGGSGLGGSGQGGTGATDKGAGGNQDKSAKNVGESLEFLKQKAIQEKKIELWAKEQEANDMNLLMAQTRNEAIKSIVGAMAKSLGDCAGKLVVGGNCVDPTSGFSFNCVASASGKNVGMSIPGAKVASGPGGCDSKDGGKAYFLVGDSMMSCGQPSGAPVATGCVKSGIGGPDPASGSGNNNGTGATTLTPDGKPMPIGGGISLPTGASLDGLGAMCKDLKTLNGAAATAAAQQGADKPWDKVKSLTAGMYGELRTMTVVRDAVYKGAGSGDCSDPELGKTAAIETKDKKSIQAQLREVVTLTRGKADDDASSAIALMTKAAKDPAPEKMPDALPGSAELTKAQAALAAVSPSIDAAKNLVTAESSDKTLAHNTATPEGLPTDFTAKVNAYKGNIGGLYSQAKNAADAAGGIRDNINVGHRQLVLIVQKSDSGDPTLKGVLESKGSEAKLAKRAETDGITASAAPADAKKDAAGVPGLKPTQDAIAAAKKAQTDPETVQVGTESIPKGLLPALDYYEGQKKTYDSMPANSPQVTQVKTQVGNSLRDSDAAAASAGQQQADWLKQISDQTPSLSMIPEK